MSERADLLEQAAVERLNRADRLTLRALAVVLVVLLTAGWFAFDELDDAADDVQDLVSQADTALLRADCRDVELVETVVGIVDTLIVVFAAQGDLEHPEVADQVEQLVARRDELALVTESCP